MKTAHLFAGIGGSLLADRILGFNPVVAIDKDGYCCDTLARHRSDWFPNLSVIHADIREWNPASWAGRVDLIHAGFPCQDISTAGGGTGLDGPRSGLVWEVFRVLDAVRPKFLFLENSPAIRLRGRNRILAALVARGYAYRDGVLAASALGAPHARMRWWLLAADADGLRELQQDRGIALQWRRPAHGSPPTDAVGARCNERGNPKDESAGAPGKRAAPDSGWWAAEPDVVRMVHGLPGRVDRVRALGNAQIPLQAAAAFLSLSEIWPDADPERK